MANTITVKGVGRATVSPDLVILSMNLESKDLVYAKAMETASENQERLTKALTKAGFHKKSIKTSNFNVNTDYEYVHHPDGRGESVFAGYVVNQGLKVEFDFDSKRLLKALAAIGECDAHPQLSIQFTVKDRASVNEALLRSATDNARRKAEVLCEASGKKLGELLSINYNWSELELVSNS